MWTPTQVELDTVDWKGKPIHLSQVPAIRNKTTGKAHVYPAEVAKAELRMIADKHGLEPRDIGLMLLLYAKPGPFEEGEIFYKYTLNKMLFYQWREINDKLLGDAPTPSSVYTSELFIHDYFEAANRGPVPKHLDQDLRRLQDQSLIVFTWSEHWGPQPTDRSIICKLTPKGTDVAHSIWNQVPDPYKEITLKVKERLYPLDPSTIRDRVHKEFPEYKKTYTDLDRD